MPGGAGVFNPAQVPDIPDVILRARYVETCFPGYAEIGGSLAWAVEDTLLVPIDIWWPVIVDRIIFQQRASAGNVRMAIYAEGPTQDLPDGGALVVETASVAAIGANAIQAITIPETRLAAGPYWVGLRHDDAALSVTSGLSPTPGLRHRRLTEAYGAFADPCPATTAYDYPPLFWLRVAQNLAAGGA